MPIRFAKYGVRELLVCTLVAGAVCGGAAWGAAAVSVWILLAALPVVALWGWVLWFFRDPQREAPGGEGIFISPADGRVVEIRRLGPDGPLGEDGVLIAIFMSIFDVHVNRCPIAARVVGVTRGGEKYLDARNPQSSQQNVSTDLHLVCSRDGEEYPLIVRQIVGFIARRIVTDVHAGENLAAGQRIGMIKFGSRVELIVPDALVGNIEVEIGRRVRAGRTVLITAADGANDE